jgi:hypothetical protein
MCWRGNIFPENSVNFLLFIFILFLFFWARDEFWF